MSSKNILSFLAGIAVGSVATYIFCTRRYGIGEEIEEVTFEEVKKSKDEKNPEGNVSENNSSVKEKAAEAQRKPDIMDYAKKLMKEHGYSQENNEEDHNIAAPYTVSPEEFGKDETYETVELVYYADNILADDMDEMVEDVDSTVGFDSLNSFGEFEDDSVFVKNDQMKVYFEILRSEQKYMDMIRSKTGNEEESED